MVKIYKGDVLKHGDPTMLGGYYLEMPDTVSLQDYQSLQAALREALEEWELAGWDVDSEWGHNSESEEREKRIAELRKQFLDI